METSFGKYALVRKVGAGGMAEVFLARTAVAQGLAKSLVLKMIHPAYARSRQFVTMFVDEAKIALGLNHPNIVQVFDFGAVDGTYFLAMEHVEGLDLLRLLQDCAAQRRRVPYGLACYIVQQVAKGLDYAHRKTDEFGDPLAIVHRDISPQNVLLSWDGAVKIVDFGIARARGVHEEDGVIKGKFSYMSPEQARGEPVDCRSDVFAAGIVLYEMVCARPLFPGKGRVPLEAVRSGVLPGIREFAPQIPELLEGVLRRALAFDRNDRYATARDLQNDLTRCILEWAQHSSELADSSLLAQFLSTVVPAERRVATARPPSSSQASAIPPVPSSIAMLAGSGPIVSGVVAPIADSSAISMDLSVPLATGMVREPTPLRDQIDRKYVYVLDGVLRGVAALEARLGLTAAQKLLADFSSIARDVAFKYDAVFERSGTQPALPGESSALRIVVGLPLASEDDADRVVRLGLALIDALDGVIAGVEPELRLALGVQRGAARVSRTAPGQPLAFELEDVTAAFAWRLARQAQGGEILVGGRVYRAARSEWEFEALAAIDIPVDFDGAPALRVDDDTDPGVRRARVYRLRGAKARAQRMRERATYRGNLLGRDLELKALRDLYRDVVLSRSKRQLTLIGDVGIGKRALVSTFLESLAPTEAMVVRATTRLSTSMTPYGIVADMARDLLGLAEDAEPHEVERRLLRALPLVYPGEEHQREARGALEVFSLLLGVRTGLAPVGGGIDADERRARLLQILLRVERMLSPDKTLVVVGEDAHWADEQSQELFAELLKIPTNRPILGILTTRPDAAFAARTVRAGGQMMVLEELPESAARELLEQRFAPEADAGELVRQILERAGGNPLFIHEILDALSERGVVEAEPADTAHAGQLRWVRRDAALVVPSSIEDALATRFDALGSNERDTLLHAAVLGRTFTAAAVTALLGRPAKPMLDELVVRGLMQRVGFGESEMLRFKNEMTMTVAYRLVELDVRHRLHREAANRLANAPGYRPGQDDATIARHLELAGDAIAAADRYLRAASHAVGVGGNADAYRQLSRALRLLPATDHARRFHCHVEREEMLRRLARRKPQLRELHAMRREAEALGDVSKLARAHATLAQFHIDVGRAPAAARAVTPALQYARASGDPLAEAEALRLRAVIARLLGNHAEALRLVDEALAHATTAHDRVDKTSDPSNATPALLSRATIMGARGEALWATGELEAAIEAFAEALVIYRALARPRLEARALTQMGVVFAGLGEYEEALAHYKSGLKIDQDLGDRAGVAGKLAAIGQCYSDIGDLPRAEGYLQKALALADQTSDLGAAAAAAISLGQARIAAGAFADAIVQLERGLRFATENRERYQEIRALEYLALAQLRAGQPGEGALELARSGTSLARQMPMPIGIIYGRIFEALALTKLGRHAEAMEASNDAVERCRKNVRAEGTERILRWHADVCAAAGLVPEAAAANLEASHAVQRAAARIKNPGLRAAFLATRNHGTVYGTDPSVTA